jgi:hypothetical protein
MMPDAIFQSGHSIQRVLTAVYHTRTFVLEWNIQSSAAVRHYLGLYANKLGHAPPNFQLAISRYFRRIYETLLSDHNRVR